MPSKSKQRKPPPPTKSVIPKWLRERKPPKRPKNMPNVLWLLKWAALLVVLSLRSYNPAQNVTFDSLVEPSSTDKGAREVLILTAHPDDEVMFFSPTILSLLNQGWNVNGLCLSTGDADKLGHTRRQELYKSYTRLGVKEENVYILDDERFQDGPKYWDRNEIAQVVKSHLLLHPASLIITFDHGGITNHPNHISLSLGTSSLDTSPNPRIIHLKSPRLADKFTGPFKVIQHIFTSNLHRLFPRSTSSNDITVVSGGKEWVKGLMAMLEHKTQLVWFRWLYLVFSSLMWVNELVVVR